MAYNRPVNRIPAPNRLTVTIPVLFPSYKVILNFDLVILPDRHTDKDPYVAQPHEPTQLYQTSYTALYKTTEAPYPRPK